MYLMYSVYVASISVQLRVSVGAGSIQKSTHESAFFSPHAGHTQIYIYIYIYICMCVRKYIIKITILYIHT